MTWNWNAYWTGLNTGMVAWNLTRVVEGQSPMWLVISVICMVVGVTGR